MTALLDFVIAATGAYANALFGVVLVPLFCICVIFGLLGVISCIR